VRIADLAPPHQVQRRVGHDAVQPRAERLIGKKAVERLEGVEETLLNRVLRVLVREHDRATDGVRPTLMQSHELRECFTLSALRRDDQRLLSRLAVTE